MQKIEISEIEEFYDKLKKNVEAVGLNDLEKGKYQKAWHKAIEDFRNLLKNYAYAEYCNGVVGCLEADAIEDASKVAILATKKTFDGIVVFDQILPVLKGQYNAILEKEIKELMKLSEELNSPIFIDNSMFAKEEK